MTDGHPPVGPTVFALFAMKERVAELRAKLRDPNASDEEILAAIEEANRWTLAVETLLESEELWHMRELLEAVLEPPD